MGHPPRSTPLYRDPLTADTPHNTSRLICHVFRFPLGPCCAQLQISRDAPAPFHSAVNPSASSFVRRAAWFEPVVACTTNAGALGFNASRSALQSRSGLRLRYRTAQASGRVSRCGSGASRACHTRVPPVPHKGDHEVHREPGALSLHALNHLVADRGTDRSLHSYQALEGRLLRHGLGELDCRRVRPSPTSFRKVAKIRWVSGSCRHAATSARTVRTCVQSCRYCSL